MSEIKYKSIQMKLETKDIRYLQLLIRLYKD